MIREFRVMRPQDLALWTACAVLLAIVGMTMAAQGGPLALVLVFILVVVPLITIWVLGMFPSRIVLGNDRVIFEGPFGRRKSVSIGDIESVEIGYARQRHVRFKTPFDRIALDFTSLSDGRQVLLLLEALSHTKAADVLSPEVNLLVDCLRRVRVAQESDPPSAWVATARSAAARGKFSRSRFLYALAGRDLAPCDADVASRVQMIDSMRRRVPA